MLGWLADSFRSAWALLYWNARKSWFRSHRDRAACPCQSPSDSGRAYETSCDACIHWHRPERFARVCPLLVRTKDGLRCSANTEDVRPFWGIAVRRYGLAALALYAAGVLAIFGFLRSVGYPISIIEVGFPPFWDRIGRARGWFFLEQSRQSFAAGKTSAGLLYLANAYEFDPSSYEVGLALARAHQLASPMRSDEVFSRLLTEHPRFRSVTAQQWFRSLLSRGEFDQVAKLAAEEVKHSPKHGNAWMRALVFATQQGGDPRHLRGLLEGTTASTATWKPVIDGEQAARSGAAAWRAEVLRELPAGAPPYCVVYRVESLIALGDPKTALDVLIRERARLDDEAYWTLRLHCLAAVGSVTQLRSEFQTLLLDEQISQPRLKMMCAQLIRHPDRELFDRVVAKVTREKMPLNDETAGGWFSLLCAAGAVGSVDELHALVLRLRHTSNAPFSALHAVEAFFRGRGKDRHATSFLPLLPLPLEVTYALIERYPGAAGRKAAERPRDSSS